MSDTSPRHRDHPVLRSTSPRTRTGIGRWRWQRPTLRPRTGSERR